MPVENDLLTGAAEELRLALEDNHGRPVRAWSEAVRRAVIEVERAMRRHAGEESPGDDLQTDPDRALLPSPGVERRAEGIRQDLDDLLREVRALRIDLSTGPSADPARAALANRCRELLRALERLDAQEIDLIQESITPDIGAGD
jgi:hypothetical protein